MLRRMVLSFCCAVLIALLSGGGVVLANHHSPPFEKVFPPADLPISNFAVMGRTIQFGHNLYITTSTTSAPGGQIFRSKDGDTWEAVTTPGYGVDPNYMMSWDATIFQGRLYIPVNSYGTPGYSGVILRTRNGTDWEQIPLATGDYQLDKIGVFNGNIYATSVWNGGQIWRSANGDPGTWQVVQEFAAGLGSSSSPTEFRGRLYFSAYVDASQDIQIWSSADGLNWDTTLLRVASRPVDPNSDWVCDSMVYVYHEHLYLAIENTIDGAAIFRTQDGRHWEQVLSGIPDTIGYTDMIAYQGELFATGFYATSTDYGTQLWSSRSGKTGTWQPVPIEGWGGTVLPLRGALSVFKGALYIADSEGDSPGLYRFNLK